MGICKYYDSIAANAMGKSFDSIIHDEGDRAYIVSYEFAEYVGNSYCFMRDYTRVFERIASYLQEGDLYKHCLEIAEIDADSFMGSKIAGSKPLELLAWYEKLCKLNRQRGYYNDEIWHLQSLPLLESFIITCVNESLKFWQMEVEYMPELWEMEALEAAGLGGE